MKTPSQLKIVICAWSGRLSFIILLALLLTGCVVGPDYKKPQVAAPPDWGWKLAQPSDAAIKSDWWELFQDPVLDQLETQATGTNQLLQIAVAHVDQARAVARIAESHFFPQLSFDPSINSFHTQLNHVPSELTATAYTIPLDLSYEVDLWGKIRRSFQSAQAQADANVADYYNVLLTLHGDVAVNYFLLRQLDAQITLLNETLALRQNSVQITAERYHTGLASELDLDLARTQLAKTKTLVTETQRQRDDLQNALALLCGQPAATFQIKPGTLDELLPAIPVGLPSALLERRPDVAEAERKMAAANAQIGVAKAAFFPAITLTGGAGYSSFNAGNLLNWESQLFQIGPSAALPIFNGGRLKAGLKEAQANYQATCASYRQQVLIAFKDVSDSLVDLDSYGQQVVSETDAVDAANRAANVSRERYKRGLINYLDVLDSERTQLETQSKAIQIHALQLVSTVHLIKALGGGFEAGSLATDGTRLGKNNHPTAAATTASAKH
ncbi:MAG TPA: efflux transporter outer membrane subunit [Candidatus Paceibacterota bacterium]|nr:efflux transporter outer membrane subunit [Candidatus Paceibacterota bacterium]